VDDTERIVHGELLNDRGFHYWRLHSALARWPDSSSPVAPAPGNRVHAISDPGPGRSLGKRYSRRWVAWIRPCAMQRVEIVDGVYQVRDDEPTPRIGAALHTTL
jgi:hypothetical protein